MTRAALAHENAVLRQKLEGYEESLQAMQEAAEVYMDAMSSLMEAFPEDERISQEVRRVHTRATALIELIGSRFPRFRPN